MPTPHHAPRRPHSTATRRAPFAPWAAAAAAATALLLAPLAACLSGCGYSQVDYSAGGGRDAAFDDAAAAAPATQGYPWRSLYREDVRTVAVPIFTNRSFERNVEFNLSKAVVNYIESNTPYKVVPKERADSILEGEITRVDIETVSNSPFNALPQEQLLTLRVNFTWKDLRTGRVLAQRRGFEQSGTYYPTLGEGRFVGAQQNVERLAVGIVQELQADW